MDEALGSPALDEMPGRDTAVSRPSRISVVVPIFNERDAIKPFFDEVVPILDALDCSWEIIVIDDGSSDGSSDLVREVRPSDRQVVVVQLARSFGKEAAVSAGVDLADGDAVVVMDVDLQDPPSLIGEFVRLWREGADIVYGARDARASDSLLKRRSARAFYRIFNRLADVKIPADAGDYRLMDSQVVDVFRLFPERSRFMKGLFSWPGFTVASVPYDRPARTAGKTSWSYPRLWRYGLEGIFNFSSVPLRVWTYLGLTIALLGLSFGVIVVVQNLFFGNEVRGYSSLIVIVTVLGGVQITGLGLLGEYLSRIFVESKRRPLYVVRTADRMPSSEVMRNRTSRIELETFTFRRSDASYRGKSVEK